MASSVLPAETRMSNFWNKPAVFTKKYGMHICCSIFLFTDAMLLGQSFWHPEGYNFLRNIIGAGLQAIAGVYLFMNRKAIGYDYAVPGGLCHTIANFSQGLYFGGIMWAIFTEASYHASNWPRRVQRLFGTTKLPTLCMPLCKAFDSTKQSIVRRKNNVVHFINNHFDLLKDAHARAGCAALISSTGQFIEAAINHRTELMMIMPFWILAGAFYAAHGLLHAQDAKFKAVFSK